MMMVQEMMTTDVVSISPDASLAQALECMRHYHIRHLPVMLGRQLKGLLTDRDFRQAMPSSATTLSLQQIAEKMETIRVQTCMTTPVISVSPSVDTIAAARQLFENRVGCLPVLDEDRLVGMVTITDFLYGFIASTMSDEEPMSVKQCMQRGSLTAAPTDIVRTAYHRMKCARIRHLPVVGVGGQLIGLITERHTRRLQASTIPPLAAYERREPTYTLTVQDVMTRDVRTVGGETPVTDAAQHLLKYKFGCLPVVSARGTLEGILTATDIVRQYVHQREKVTGCRGSDTR